MPIRTRTFARAAAAAAALAIALPARARGDDAPAQAAPQPSASATGRDAFESGKTLFRDGDYAGALVKFRLAYEQSKDGRALWNMAVCEKNLRHYANVLRLSERYLRDVGPQLSEEERTRATELVRALRPLVSSVRITVDQPGAAIFVDDQQVGTSPMVEEVLVDLGARRIKVAKPGFKEVNFSTEISGGTGVPEELRIPLEKDKEAERGQLEVNAGPKDSIEIDGRKVGVGTWTGALRAGDHTVRVSGPDEKPAEQELTLKDGETRTLQFTLEKQPKSLTWLWIAGGATVLAGGVVGSYLLLKPSGGSNAATRQSPPKGNISPGIVQVP
jgi:hypothetical protein